MRPRSTSAQLFRCLTKLTFFLVYLGLGSVCASGVTETKVFIRENIQPIHRELLESKLREITGWQDLNFDPNGFLQLRSKETSKGSAGARKLLGQANSGANLIVLEDASSRTDVVFCRVVQARWLQSDPTAPSVFIVLLDFADFEKVMGDKQARAAFDVGWAFLHEVDHVVRDSHDPIDDSIAGDCEDNINEMRREVGLPRRVQYFFSSVPYNTDSRHVSRFVRMRFEQFQKPNKVKRYWLIWDAALVGGLPDSQIASAL
jgi:hypothetical protein